MEPLLRKLHYQARRTRTPARRRQHSEEPAVLHHLRHPRHAQDLEHQRLLVLADAVRVERQRSDVSANDPWPQTAGLRLASLQSLWIQQAIYAGALWRQPDYLCKVQSDPTRVLHCRPAFDKDLERKARQVSSPAQKHHGHRHYVYELRRPAQKTDCRRPERQHQNLRLAVRRQNIWTRVSQIKRSRTSATVGRTEPSSRRRGIDPSKSIWTKRRTSKTPRNSFWEAKAAVTQKTLFLQTTATTSVSLQLAAETTKSGSGTTKKSSTKTNWRATLTKWRSSGLFRRFHCSWRETTPENWYSGGRSLTQKATHSFSSGETCLLCRKCDRSQASTRTTTRRPIRSNLWLATKWAQSEYKKYSVSSTDSNSSRSTSSKATSSETPGEYSSTTRPRKTKKARPKKTTTRTLTTTSKSCRKNPTTTSTTKKSSKLFSGKRTKTRSGSSSSSTKPTFRSYLQQEWTRWPEFGTSRENRWARSDKEPSSFQTKPGSFRSADTKNSKKTETARSKRCFKKSKSSETWTCSQERCLPKESTKRKQSLPEPWTKQLSRSWVRCPKHFTKT